MQANKQDTIDFRECNISSILSNYGHEWSQLMRQIRFKNISRYRYIFNHYNYEIKYNYHKDSYIKQINEILPHDKFRLTNREHKLRKSFQKHETKRRNKMIQIH